MSNAKISFENNILNISNSVSIYKYLNEKAQNLDSTILLRSQYVLIVSALDTYIHSAITNRIVDLFFSQNSNFNVNVDIPLSTVFSMKNSDEIMQRQILLSCLKKKFSKDSYQSPKSIEYICSVLEIKHIWKEIGQKIGKNAEDTKNQLALIINRRNKIAHESDWNESTRQYETITLQTVLDCQKFIKEFVLALDDLIFSS